MAKVFIIGAGFSKAVAELPVMTEMETAFKRVLSEEIDKNHKNRIVWGHSLFDFWASLQKEFLEVPLRQVGDKRQIVKSNFWENFEAVLSFIDLNCNTEIFGTLLDDKAQTSSIHKKEMFYFGRHDLSGIRSMISTYLYLALIKAVPNQLMLKSFSEKILEDGDVIISFNYDLLLEQFLFAERKWFPKDGYGLSFGNFPAINPSFDVPSQVTLLKLHGSLNWKTSFFIPFELIWATDENESIFPEYLSDPPKKPFVYQGGHVSDIWLLPSWIKIFDFPQLILSWKKAAQVIAKASDIYVIGYSLPLQDTATISLLGTADYNHKKVCIIDPSARTIVERLRQITQLQDIEILSMKFEEYLASRANNL